MTEVLAHAPLDIVQLQMDEMVQHGMDLEDAEYAYRLQLQEAMQASAPTAEIDCTAISDVSQPAQATVSNQIQVRLVFSLSHSL